jgi:tetratricopeptide (TPR) repeat protein
MSDVSPRLSQLLTMLEKEPNDAFLLYGVAMEHKKAGRLDEAIEYLDRTIAADALYCYAFYQKGQVQEQQGDTKAARQAYELGITAAMKKGDAHAKSELETALAML